jgi:hypothetical protein
VCSALIAATLSRRAFAAKRKLRNPNLSELGIRDSEKGEVMTMPMDWDPTPIKTKKRSALKVPAPFGVLPYKGARNPQTRSNSAQRVSFAMATPATNYVRQIYHFDSGGEFSVALEASLAPDLHALEVQLPEIRYPWKYNKRGYRDHYFDFRLTFKDGHRRAVYVKNGTGLKSETTRAEIDMVFSCVDEGFADDMIVVNSDHYTRAYRDNLRRFWHLAQDNRPEDDAVVEAAAHSTNYWLLSDLISQCPIPSADAWQASMRLIARGVLGANWHSVITYRSRIWLPE